MAVPLCVATRGFILRTTLSVATRGFLGALGGVARGTMFAQFAGFAKFPDADKDRKLPTRPDRRRRFGEEEDYNKWR